MADSSSAPSSSEQRIRSLVLGFPKLAIVLEPRVGLGERLSFEPAWPALRIAAVRNEPVTLRHLEALGDRRLAHGKRLDEFVHRCLAQREDCPLSGVGRRCESCAKALFIATSMTE